MAENILILCPTTLPEARISAVAKRSGSTLGLVNTRLDPSEQKHSGGRIEEMRDFGGVAFHTFDEPLCVGSAIAQLAGYADAVLVLSLEDWARRLTNHHWDEERVQSEVTSVASVLSAQLADVVLVSGPARAGDDPAVALHRRMLDEFRPHLTETVDWTGS